MSHVVRIQTEVRDSAAVFAACRRRQLGEPVAGKHRLYSSEVEGLAVSLRDWSYPFGSVDPYSEEFFGRRNDWWHSELRRHSERSQRFHDSHSFRRIWPHIKRSVTD